MADRYANILKIMFLTAFYASILPIGIIISCFGLIITYWVSKVLMKKNEYSITFLEDEQ